MKRADQSADGNALLPHEAAQYCKLDHAAHVAELLATIRREAADDALRTLRRRGLQDSDIDQLLAELREDIGLAKMRATWPTPREQRAIVETVARSAQALREALGALPPITQQKLWLEVSRAGIELPSTSHFDMVLLALAHVGSDAAQEKPAQARARARVGIVTRVHRIAPRIALSAAAGSVFYDLCTAAFVLAGETEDPMRAWRGRRHPKPTDPKGAIRAYIARAKAATGKQPAQSRT
ncbi:MAG TPA: hypothetical protein PKB14_22570 [Rubrivivax sp.]|mgnify:CR=1 FL=1|nr:hypothetical protein [Rubrivivax sp.]